MPKTLLKRFFLDRRATTAVEYCLIAVLVSLAIFAGVGQMANSIEWLFSNTTDGIAQAF
jgi:pilus assembly protein Flp/PilA